VLEIVNKGATLSSLSVVDISQQARVSRNAMYRRWKTKEEILVDVVKSIRRAALVLTEHSARENLVMMLDLSSVSDVDPRVFRLERAINAESNEFPVLFEYYSHDVATPLTNGLKSAIRSGKDTGEIRVDVDENALVAVLVSSMSALDGSGSQRLVDLVFDGVSPH
jgi:AcrR family transcriptional regulator